MKKSNLKSDNVNHILSESNYYSILYINKSASFEEIKKAYKRLALKFHPNRNKDTKSKEIFDKLSIAYNVLSNQEKRKNYDTYGNEYGNIDLNKNKICINDNEIDSMEVFNKVFKDNSELDALSLMKDLKLNIKQNYDSYKLRQPNISNSFNTNNVVNTKSKENKFSTTRVVNNYNNSSSKLKKTNNEFFNSDVSISEKSIDNNDENESDEDSNTKYFFYKSNREESGNEFSSPDIRKKRNKNDSNKNNFYVTKDCKNLYNNKINNKENVKKKNNKRTIEDNINNFYSIVKVLSILTIATTLFLPLFTNIIK